MTDLSRQNPTGRFTGLEDLYARHRPSYPAEAVDYVVRRCRLDATTLLVDVGCGTGISTRLFASRGIPAVGVEPNDAMREKAEAEPPPPGGSAPTYRKGTAEATGLADGCAGAVLAAQAFHWFDAPKALREFWRLLRPGGHAVLLWNIRDKSDPFTAAYGDVIHAAPGAAAVEVAYSRPEDLPRQSVPHSQSADAFLKSSLFTDADEKTFPSAQELDEEGVIGRAQSASYAPREAAEVAAFVANLRRVFAEYQRGGRVTLRYVTRVFVGRRREAQAG